MTDSIKDVFKMLNLSQTNLQTCKSEKPTAKINKAVLV